MDRLEEASRRVLRTIFAKFCRRWLSEKVNEHKDLAPLAHGIQVRVQPCLIYDCKLIDCDTQKLNQKRKKERYIYLPVERKDTSPIGKVSMLVSRKLDALTEKCCIVCVCMLLTCRESQIAFTKFEESLQLINSSDLNASLFWLRSLHKSSTCEICHSRQLLAVKRKHST